VTRLQTARWRSPANIDLLISDESRLFCQSLRIILETRKTKIVGEVRCLVDALAILRSPDSRADVLLCDLPADAITEFETMAFITGEFPETRVILLTDRRDPDIVSAAVAAGASGFLAKDISADGLCLSIELVLLGEKIFPLSRPLLEPAMDIKTTGAPTPHQSRGALLSPRESQILSCLIDGLSNKTIARDLNMAEGTVKVHLRKLLRKLDVQNRTQAALWGKDNFSTGTQRP
jgi:two-component system nitrate/nitrite response regulator NarL